MKIKTYTCAVSSIALLSAMGVSAYAQVGDDEIVVTATRRAESVQDIPLNIAAIGGAQIEEQGFDELSDLLTFVPGINLVDRGGRQGNPIIVRGLNATALGSGDGNNDFGGTVATYIGEIPLYLDLKLNDLERVEVLLGPQGTLYGAGTLGGAIRFIPKKPDFSSDSLSVRAEAFQYDEADSLSTDFGFTFNKSLGDRFAVRGSLDVRNDSGFIDYPFVVQEIGVSEPDPDFSNPTALAANFSPIEDANSEDTISGRIAARWQPIDALDAVLTYYYQEADIGGRQFSSRRSTVPVGRYEAGLRVPEPNVIKNELLALEVTADLGFAELTSATGYSEFEDDGQRDQTDLLITLEYSYELFPTFTAFTNEQGIEERFNQEVRLVSTHGGPINWIVGAFYNSLDTAGFSAEFTPGYAQFAGFDRPDNLEYFSQGVRELEEMALYGEFGVSITDRWTITVGGRYYDYDLVTYDRVDFPLFDPDFVARSVSEVDSDLSSDPLAEVGGQSDNGSLFKFNTSYEVSDNALVYLTVSEGYRIGNSNGVAPCPQFDPLDNQQGACALAPGQRFGPGPDDLSQRDEFQFGPDQTTNYEIGLKSTLFDNTLQFNLAAYYIEWSEPQLSSATVNANIPITINADGAESQGVEVSANWRPTDTFNLRGSYSHTQAQLTEPVLGLIRDIDTPGFDEFFIDGEAGDRLPGAPEDQFSIFATYEKPLAGGQELIYNIGYSWQGDVLSRAGGRGDSFNLESFGLADASITYKADRWQVSLFAENLFNEFAETGVRSSPPFNQTVAGANVRSFGTFVAPPRAIGVRMRWDIAGE